MVWVPVVESTWMLSSVKELSVHVASIHHQSVAGDIILCKREMWVIPHWLLEYFRYVLIGHFWCQVQVSN